MKRLVLSLLCVSQLFLFVLSAQAADAPRHVLVLHSYHVGYDWTDEIVHGVRSVFAESGDDIVVSMEFMDTKRLASDDYFVALYELYSRKFSHAKFDIIISSDDNARLFLQEYGEKLFPNVPIVFCGLNDILRSGVLNMPNTTAVGEEVDVLSTLKLIRQLVPTAEKLLVVSDATVTGRVFTGTVRSMEPLFRSSFQFEYVNDVTREELMTRLNHLDSRWVVLFFLFVRDSEGTVFSLNEAAQLVGNASPVPVFTVYDFNLKHGIVGGKLTSGLAQGIEAARLALRILQGVPIKSIAPVLQSPNQFMFDANALKRFGISTRDLPEASTILNKSPMFSLRQQAFWLSVVGGVVLFLLVVIVWLAIGSFRKQKAAQELRAFSEELEGRVLQRTQELSEVNQRLEEELEERNAARSALEMSERALRTVLNSVDDGILMHERDGTIRDVNEKVLNMYGVSRAEFMEMSLAEDLSGEGSPVEYLEKVWGALKFGESVTFEWRARRPRDGSEFDADVCLTGIELAKRPMVLATVRDISERKIQERKLLRLAMAMEQSADAIFITDPSRILLYVNPAFARVTGLASDEIIGRKSTVLWQVLRDERVAEEMVKEVSAGRIWNGTLVVTPRGSVPCTLKGTYTPVRDERGNVVSFVGVFHDITEHNRLTENLREAFRMDIVGRVATRLAGKAVQMLGAVFGTSKEIAVEDATPVQDDNEPALGNVLSALARLGESVDNENMESLCVAVEDALTLIRFVWGQHVTVECVYDEGVLLSLRRGQVLRQALLAIVENSIPDLEKDGGEPPQDVIAVSVVCSLDEPGVLAPDANKGGEAGQHVVVTIRSSGAPYGKAGKLFGNEKASKEGLRREAVIKSLIDEQGGRMEVSRDDLAGDTVVITFPLGEDV